CVAVFDCLCRASRGWRGPLRRCRCRAGRWVGHGARRFAGRTGPVGTRRCGRDLGGGFGQGWTVALFFLAFWGDERSQPSECAAAFGSDGRYGWVPVVAC